MGNSQKNICIHYDVTDDMMRCIYEMHARADSVIKKVEEAIKEADCVCEEIPQAALNRNLIVQLDQFQNELIAIDCINTGREIVDSMQGLVENLHATDETYAGIMRDMGDYFGTKCEGELVPTFHAGAGFIEEISIDDDMVEEWILNNPVFYDDLIKYIKTYYATEYKLYTSVGIPTSVQQIAWEKIKKAILERSAVHKEAADLQADLMSMEEPCKWSEEFLSLENCIELIDIFNRHGVDSAELRSYFLAHVYAETGGGRGLREELNDYPGEIKLESEFNEEASVEYILYNADYYLPDPQYHIYKDYPCEEGFIKAISSSYRTGDVERYNTYYISNDLNSNRARGLASYIGSGVDEPYRISDIVKYRGGGALQVTLKENYYRLAYYIETEYKDPVAAQDIRENGCYSKYMEDEYCLKSAEWYYFVYIGETTEKGDFVEITDKICGNLDDYPRRSKYQEAIYNALSK